MTDSNAIMAEYVTDLPIKMSREHLATCVIAYPVSKAFATPLSNMEKILRSFSDVCIIIGTIENIRVETDLPGVRTYEVRHKTTTNAFVWILRYLLLEVRISLIMAKVAQKADVCMFFMEGGALLPVLIAKVLGKKIIRVVPSSILKETAKSHRIKRIALLPLICLQTIAYTLSDRIVLYSPDLVKEWGLEKYKNKICIACEHFLDFDTPIIRKKYGKRRNLVGYIGRLDEEKGVLNLVKAVPEIMKEKDDVEFLIGGDGWLRDEIKKYIRKENLDDKVKLTGWIPHDEIPYYLNTLKLVVLPSYTEGLPNLMLEAMAYGTPVLATPVGAIQDVIKDGETGFIMKDNSPECIAENVVRALNHPDKECIVGRAEALVAQTFTYKAAAERYKEIVGDI